MLSCLPTVYRTKCVMWPLPPRLPTLRKAGPIGRGYTAPPRLLSNSPLGVDGGVSYLGAAHAQSRLCCYIGPVPIAPQLPLAPLSDCVELSLGQIRTIAYGSIGQLSYVRTP
jgi:hypothetical protein